tara:strand:+ start:279 stop:458 length:180 start_codon:yes stop_codon:yes gene_type:complete
MLYDGKLLCGVGGRVLLTLIERLPWAVNHMTCQRHNVTSLIIGAVVTVKLLAQELEPKH